MQLHLLNTDCNLMSQKCAARWPQGMNDTDLCDLNWPVAIVVFEIAHSIVEDLEVSLIYFEASNVIFS